MNPSNTNDDSSMALKVIERVRTTNDGEATDYFLSKDGREINLSKKIQKEIRDVSEVFENDLVFIWVGDEDEIEHSGLYSFRRGDIIFPFIIQEYDQIPSGFFRLFLLEDWQVNWNNFDELPENFNGSTHAYLHRDGTFFQSIGEPIEQLDRTRYILETPGYSQGRFVVFNTEVEEEEDGILLDGLIKSPKHFEKLNLLVYSDRSGSGIFNLKDNKSLFYSKGVTRIDLINQNFFEIVFVKDNLVFIRILDTQGNTVMQYSSHYKTSTSPQKEQYRTLSTIELYHENDFYTALLNDFIIEGNTIKLKAFNILKQESIILCWESSISI